MRRTIVLNEIASRGVRSKLNGFRYGMYAPVYDWILGGIYSRRVGELFRNSVTLQYHNFLEIGIGTGLTLEHYPKGISVTGIDPSAGMLKKAELRRRSSSAIVKLVQATAEEYIPMVSTFDAVVLCHSLSVIPKPKQSLKALLEELPDGASVFIVNHFTPESGFLKWFDQLMSPLGALLGFKTYFCLSWLHEERYPFETVVLRDGYWKIIQIKKGKN